MNISTLLQQFNAEFEQCLPVPCQMRRTGLTQARIDAAGSNLKASLVSIRLSTTRPSLEISMEYPIGSGHVQTAQQVCQSWLAYSKSNGIVPQNATINIYIGVQIKGRGNDTTTLGGILPRRLRSAVEDKTTAIIRFFLNQWRQIEPRVPNTALLVRNRPPIVANTTAAVIRRSGRRRPRLPPSPPQSREQQSARSPVYDPFAFQTEENDNQVTCAFCLCEVDQLFAFQDHPIVPMAGDGDTSHICCRDCAKMYVMSCVTNHPLKIPITCIHNTLPRSSDQNNPAAPLHARCEFEIRDADIRRLLNDQEYEQYLVASLAVVRQRDLLQGTIVELVCPECQHTVEFDRTHNGVPLLLWCECGNQWCTGCHTLVTEHEVLSEEEIELMHQRCTRAEVHTAQRGLVDLGPSEGPITHQQAKNIALLVEKAIRKESPHCPVCSNILSKDDGCNLVKCSVCPDLIVCFVCSKILPYNSIDYLLLSLNRPELVGYMMHIEDGAPIQPQDTMLNGMMHQRHAHLQGPHRHDPENPRANGNLCPHNNREYWDHFQLPDYRQAATGAHPEVDCTRIFLEKCMIRGLLRILRWIGPIRFMAGLELFPHRNDPAVLRAFNIAPFGEERIWSLLPAQ